MTLQASVLASAQRARKASIEFTGIKTQKKNQVLRAMASALRKNITVIITSNKKDLLNGKKNKLSDSMLDRLMLDRSRINKMAKGLEEIARLKDPVGKIDSKSKRPAGFTLTKIRVPLGVVAIIYESRPNVTADTVGLCFKSGNACILKGGSEAIHSNRVIAKLLRDCIKKAILPRGIVEFIDSTDRKSVSYLLKLDECIDVVIPRGGEGLIRMVAAQATMPVIKHFKGVCHIYIDKSADKKMAQKLALNAKVQRPGVCNAMETLVVHKGLSKEYLKDLFDVLNDAGVRMRGDAFVRSINKNIKAATHKDWGEEYLDLRLAIKSVGDINEAIDHINTFGSRHTDAIVSKNKKNIAAFITQVDSSSVMVNATTRLADGAIYGLGAEVGISTDKLHARGPMGIDDLTTYKWIVQGNGTIRK